MRVALFGLGRLGREIVALAEQREATIAVAFGSDTPATLERLVAAKADVAIDVSVAEAVPSNAALCLAAQLPLVIGVTGWHDAAAGVTDAVEAANGGVLIAPNFSVGATLFSLAVADAARRFSAALGFDAAIVETHHAMKKDAPSGTARTLADAVHASRGTQVPVTSVRVGHVPGVHTLVLDAAFEQVTLTHEARDRRVFADGALVAARWMMKRTGSYTMLDVVRDMTGVQ
ncbi:MAG TPA: dihydrodipicolinate reductase C-terminal domain-containing protein [Gemmatimonadaceae bacterium]|nr:dihydrodipicolinate reductase C-terminal domain-containing protein [Gemmatimonadaceae bacterium]